MRILVTGGAGYIGSVTAATLLAAGHEVVVLDDLSRGHREAVPAGCRFVEGSVVDAEALDRVFANSQGAIDAVVHFAAFAYVGESGRVPERYLSNNVAGSLLLFERALAENVRRFVFSSSCTVYGEPARLPLTEEHPRSALSPYGASKLMVEEALAWMCRAHEDLRAVCLRYFNAAGAAPGRGEDHDPETHLIPLAIAAAAGRRPALVIFGDDYPTRDGTCERDYVHILDLADAHVRAIGVESGDGSVIGAASASGFHAYNVGSGEGHTVREVLEMVGRVVGSPVPVSVGPRRPGDAPALVAGGDLIRAELGWEPRASGLERIVSDAWDWQRDHPEGYGE